MCEHQFLQQILFGPFLCNTLIQFDWKFSTVAFLIVVKKHIIAVKCCHHHFSPFTVYLR